MQLSKITPLFCGLGLALATVAHANMKTFSGTDLVTNKPTTVQVAQARATVLVFVSAKCPCSLAHEETLQKLWSEFHDSGIQFLGVNSNADEDLQRARHHFGKAGFSFPVFRDDTATLANNFGALKTPHVYVLDSTGTVLYEGGIDDSRDPKRAKRHYLYEALNSIRQNQEPPLKQARALGCYLKRP